MSTVIRANLPVELDLPRIVPNRDPKNSRYEFKSFKSLLHCLNDGSFTLGLAQNTPKDSERSYYTLVGRLSGYGDSKVFVALQGDTLVEKEEKNGRVVNLFYELLTPESHRNYESRKDFEDTVADYGGCMEHARAMLNEVRQQQYPDLPCTLHIPNQIKMKKLKEKRLTGAEETEYDISDHIQKDGLLMVEFGLAWWMKFEKPQVNVLMGISVNLSKLKYLSQEQIEVAKAKAKPIISRTFKKRVMDSSTSSEDPVQEVVEDPSKVTKSD